MSETKQAVANAAARIHAMRAKGGKGEARAQQREMSKSKRVRFRKPKRKGY